MSNPKLDPKHKRQLKDAQKFYASVFKADRPVAWLAGILLSEVVFTEANDSNDAFDVHNAGAPADIAVDKHPLVLCIGRIAMKMTTQDFDIEFTDFWDAATTKADYNKLELKLLERLDWKIYFDCPHFALLTLNTDLFNLSDDEFAAADAIVARSPIVAAKLARCSKIKVSGVAVAIAAAAFVKAFGVQAQAPAPTDEAPKAPPPSPQAPTTPPTAKTDGVALAAAHRLSRDFIDGAVPLWADWAETRRTSGVGKFVANLIATFRKVFTSDVKLEVLPPPTRSEARRLPPPMAAPESDAVSGDPEWTPPAKRRRWVS